MNTARLAGTAILHRPGPGPTLVLLHGIGSNATSWAPLIAELPLCLDVLAWWAPGYGDSEPLADAHPAPAGYAARLAALLDAMDRPRVVLAGHSLGCLFAGAFAAAHPARVAAIGFLSPALGYRMAGDGPLPPPAQARLDDLASLGPERFAERRAGRLVHRAAALPAVREAMAAVRLPGYAQAVHALARGDLLADAARLAMPALVACGTEDLVTPPEAARRLHAALPGSRLHLLAACGHALPQEAPAEAAALLAGLAHA